MSAVIKASALIAEARPFHPLGGTKVEGPSPSAVREASLLARIAELETEIQELVEDLPSQLERARSEGEREALTARSDAEEKRLKQLEEAIADAKDGWSKRLKSLDSLSIGIGRAALERVFEDADQRAGQVASSIKHHLRLLEASSVVRVCVSSDDFANSEHLHELAAELGISVELVAETRLESGACTLDLKLGHLEIGPGTQWRRISDMLRQAEREGSEP